MDNGVIKIHKNVWISIQNLYIEMLHNMNVWDPVEEDNNEYEPYYLDKDIDWYDKKKANSVLNTIEQYINFIKKSPSLIDNGEHLDEEDAVIEYDKIIKYEELTDCIQRVSSMILKKDSKGVIDTFSELDAICDELNFGIENDIEEIENLLDVLGVQESTLIYSPKQKIIQIPKLILESNARLIELIRYNPDLLYKISSRKFEELIGDIFFRKGFDVQLTKSTRDGGYDILAIYSHKNLGIQDKYLIECKRYAKKRKITLGIVRELFGVKIANEANKAILATTSYFTNDAIRFANEHIWDLDLKDYDDIISWINEYYSSFNEI